MKSLLFLGEKKTEVKAIKKAIDTTINNVNPQ